MRLMVVWLMMGIPTLARAQGEVYDVVIRNGRVIDGTGSPWYAADVGIRDGRIAAIGMLEGVAARRTVDAAGMVVAPGFIDMLGQSELTILVNPSLPSKIFQGITTEITGEGGSAGPLDDHWVSAIVKPRTGQRRSATRSRGTVFRLSSHRLRSCARTGSAGKRSPRQTVAR